VPREWAGEPVRANTAGNVYVADWVRERGRVHAFAPDGRHLGTWWTGDDGQRFRSPQGIAVDAQGRILVVDHHLPALVTITPGPLPRD
jgi:sugar lactone lactonase YvrE